MALQGDREHYLTALDNAYRDLDSAILLVAGGALGLSFGLGSIAATDSLRWALIASWFTLGLSVLAVILAKFASTYALEAAIDVIEGTAGASKRHSRWRRWVLRANGASVILAALGIACLGRYLIQ